MQNIHPLFASIITAVAPALAEPMTGKTLKYSDPKPEEVDDRFLCLEDNGDRVLVEFIEPEPCQFSIKPRETLHKSHVVVA